MNMRRYNGKDTETTEDEEADDGNKIKTIGSTIYFHAEVTRKTIYELIEKLTLLETDLLKKAIELPGYVPEIKIFIHSDGGDVYAGFSGMDHLLNSKVSITTIADGCCASAATFLLLGGKTRLMQAHSYILIHQIESGGFWGKFEELKDEMKCCTNLMDMLKRVYTEKTQIPLKKLKVLMKRDVYLSSEECQQYQIVSGIFCP